MAIKKFLFVPIILWFLLRGDARQGVISENKQPGRSFDSGHKIVLSNESNLENNVRKNATKRAPGSASGGALSELQSLSEKPWMQSFVYNLDGVDTKGFPRSLSGGRVHLPGANYGEKSRNFLARFSESIFGVPISGLKLSSVEDSDPVRVIYDQFAGDIPIFSRKIVFFFEDGKLVRVQNDLFPIQGIGLPRAPSNLASEVQDIVKKTLFENLGRFQSISSPPQAIYLASSEKLILAYRTVVEISKKQELEIFLSDDFGRILKKRSLVVQ